MFNKLAHDFYVQPMNRVYIEAIAMFVLWTLAMLILRGKARRAAAAAGFVFAVVLIIMFTVFGRKAGVKTELSLIPFAIFEKAKIFPEMYRAMFMNIILFMPFGLSMPYILPVRLKRKALVVILSGFALSVIVEALQFVFKIGESETDDVIMNTLGTVAGVLSYIIVGAILALRQRRTKP